MAVAEQGEGACAGWHRPPPSVVMGMTYSVVDLNEGVVHSDNVNTTVVDAVG